MTVMQNRQYIEPEDLTKQKVKENGLNIMHCYTVSLMAKKVKIEELLEQISNLFDVIGVCETKLSNLFDVIGVCETKLRGIENTTNIDGYQFLQHESLTRHFGRVGIFIKKNH